MKKTKTLSIVEECRLYDKMWEWVDSNGKSVVAAPAATQVAPPTGAAPFGSFETQYKRLADYFKNNLTTNVRLISI